MNSTIFSKSPDGIGDVRDFLGKKKPSSDQWCQWCLILRRLFIHLGAQFRAIAVYYCYRDLPLLIFHIATNHISMLCDDPWTNGDFPATKKKKQFLGIITAGGTWCPSWFSHVFIVDINSCLDLMNTYVIMLNIYIYTWLYWIYIYTHMLSIFNDLHIQYIYIYIFYLYVYILNIYIYIYIYWI